MISSLNFNGFLYSHNTNKNTGRRYELVDNFVGMLIYILFFFSELQENIGSLEDSMNKMYSDEAMTKVIT